MTDPNSFSAAISAGQRLRGQQIKQGSAIMRCDLHLHLAADYVLANGSMSSNQSGKGEIRKALIEADLVDWIVALLGQLFYSTKNPVCLWLLRGNENSGAATFGLN